LVTFLQLPVLTYRNIKITVITNSRNLQYIQPTTISTVINKCIQYFSPIQSHLEEVKVEGGEGGEKGEGGGGGGREGGGGGGGGGGRGGGQRGTSALTKSKK
jgi:hypothetical protein